jgi:hypothetical protein
MSYNKRNQPSVTQLGTMSLPSDVTSEVVHSFYEALDCPRSLTAALLYKYQEYDQLVSLEVDPSHYNSCESFRDAYLASSLLLRSKFLETSFDREQLAIAKFLKFEDGCREVNSRLCTSLPQMNEFTGDGKLLSAMRRKIENVLGRFSPLEMFGLSSWGPGVSTVCKDEETSGSKKFQCETGITRDLYPLVRDLFPLAYPTWWSHLEKVEGFPHYEVGNAVVTVPKTSKIDRVIAIEPGLNLWLQLGLGRCIRKRLGKVGIDLTDQTRNMKLSRKASINANLTTVDFSSASDSIAYELVRTLFSEPNSKEWFDVMEVIRSQYGKIAGKVFKWNKFSSMGNGFTFDLETLIFYTAAIVCCEAHGVSTEDVSVYGDDVIIPTVAYDTFCSFSTFLGFTVNRSKSFSDGPFRESCGAHYFRGVDCKPVYLEERLDLPVRVYNFANLLRIRSHVRSFGCEKRFRLLFYKLVGSVPKKLRFRIPAVLNSKTGEVEPLEGGFISNLDEASPARQHHQLEGFIVPRLSWVAVTQEVEYFGLLQAKLLGLGPDDAVHIDDLYYGVKHARKRGISLNLSICFKHLMGRKLAADEVASRNEVPLRGRTRCVFTKTPVRLWYDLGPWAL